MDIENANIEPFHRFMKFTEAHGRTTRIIYGALQILKTAPMTADGLVSVPTGGEPWGDGANTKWKDVITATNVAGGDFAPMSLIFMLSAFEDFLVGVKAEHDRYADLIQGQPLTGNRVEVEERAWDCKVNGCSKEADALTLSALVERLGLSLDPIRYLLPLLKYFVLARNCVAHRAGRASDALDAYSTSHQLAESITAWRTSSGNPPARLPVIEAGEKIPLLPRHAIFASEVCYRAAKSINAQSRVIYGVEGFVHMAAHHSLLAEKPNFFSAKSPERVIKGILGARYQVKALKDSEAEIIAVLQKLGKWKDCVRRYEASRP